jgi:hypothetical protein
MPVRMSEIADGKRLTDCFWMTSSKDEVVTNLAMNVAKGVLIQIKFYTRNAV